MGLFYRPKPAASALRLTMLVQSKPNFGGITWTANQPFRVIPAPASVQRANAKAVTSPRTPKLTPPHRSRLSVGRLFAYASSSDCPTRAEAARRSAFFFPIFEQQGPESGLHKMLVGGESIGQVLALHHGEREAVCQTPSLIGSASEQIHRLVQ
jgi:hypothetical protein